MGFWRGSGDCHSVVISPYSLVMVTRCRQRKRSAHDCFMVGMVPRANGSAFWLFDPMFVLEGGFRVGNSEVVVEEGREIRRYIDIIRWS